jgi:transmembrane sensor
MTVMNKLTDTGTDADAGMREAAALKKEAYTWLVRLRSDGLTSEDAAAFQHWCRLPGHAQAYAQVRETWRALAPVAGAVRAEAAQAGSSVSLAAATRSWRNTGRPGRRAFLGGALAASAGYLLLRPPMGLWPSVADFTADYRTGTGEQRKITLAGGSVIQMNTQTRINVRTAADAADGIELLAGEAEIDTGMDNAGAAMRTRSPGGAITVLAGGGLARARAARFNIRRTGTQVCLTCLEGEVTLEHARGVFKIGRAQQLSYGESGVSAVSHIDAADISAWRDGILVFKDMPLAAAVAEINRYRPGKLVLMNAQLGRKRVQLRLSIAQLAEAAEMIRAVYGADLTQLPGGVVLLS